MNGQRQTDDEILNSYQVAKILLVRIGTLENWRYLKKGPPYVRMGFNKGAKVVYFRKDLFDWLDAHLVKTQQPK